MSGFINLSNQFNFGALQKYRNFTLFLGVEICGKAQFSHSFGRIVVRPTKFPHHVKCEIMVFFTVGGKHQFEHFSSVYVLPSGN